MECPFGMAHGKDYDILPYNMVSVCPALEFTVSCRLRNPSDGCTDYAPTAYVHARANSVPIAEHTRTNYARAQIWCSAKTTTCSEARSSVLIANAANLRAVVSGQSSMTVRVLKRSWRPRARPRAQDGVGRLSKSRSV
jgi:hypothetical protein